jgi:formylglycine-generating enzyme required for sulfatase activity
METARRATMKYLILSLLLVLPVKALAWPVLDWAPLNQNAAASHTSWTEPFTKMEFVYIKGGCFMMGSPEDEKDRDSDEKQHKVCVDGFWMGKYEVTNRQFRLFQPGHDSKVYKEFSLNGEDQPAVYVSWNEARDFAQWLGKKSHTRLDLPTEAQWEYAARAGTTTARFWGNDPDQACEYANVYDQTGKEKIDIGWANHNCQDGHAVTAPTGSFQANGFGLYDMLGNVWEWCVDIYGPYMDTRDNPHGSTAGGYRVFRGGSWDNKPASVRGGNRLRISPGYRYNDLGFRLARME